MIQDYFRIVGKRILESRIVEDKSIDYREFSTDEGMIRGRLLFIDGSVLEFMEYINKEEPLKYRFHLMDEGGRMIFRYDNAPHHHVSTYPHHKHVPEGVVGSKAVKIIEVLGEIEKLIVER